MKHATLVELTVVDNILPLATGYLKSYARADPDVARDWEIELYDKPVAADRHAMVAELAAANSDVYALSCYVWNASLMRWLLDRLVELVPDALFILGGPQVMHHVARYVAPERTNVVVCNGEGERTFQGYLRELLKDEPDLATVPGLSFWRDGLLVTTEAAERIKDLSEIPSPFTGGVFTPGKYTFGVLETNRGCPFNCGFCYWGAATNGKVNKFDNERVLRDIDWMSENGFVTFFIADANWGIIKRDVELTEYIVDAAKRNGFPIFVAINSAKNTPDRVVEITRTLAEGGLLTGQPISLQSMDAEVLEIIGRKNIRLEAYMTLQWSLRERGISSFVEMIWPLPGETVATYTKGLTELCQSGADTILVYPHLLLNNTPIYEAREEHGIAVRRVPDDASEADVVVSTRWLAEEEYEFGVWIYYIVQCLYNLRGLYYLSNHLDRTGQMSFGELFTAVARSFQRDKESPISEFIDNSVRNLGNYFLLNAGEVAHMTMHSHRDEFDRMLTEFVQSQPFWGSPDVAAMFELDLVARPYIYREPQRVPAYEFEAISVESRSDGSLELTVPPPAAKLITELDLRREPTTLNTFRLSHPVRQKMPFIENRTMEENISYCQAMTLHMREVVPLWEPVVPADSLAGTH